MSNVFCTHIFQHNHAENGKRVQIKNDRGDKAVEGDVRDCKRPRSSTNSTSTVWTTHDPLPSVGMKEHDPGNIVRDIGENYGDI